MLCSRWTRLQDDYYNKSDGGTKLGFWATSREQLEIEIGDLEILISNVRSVRIWPPATLEAAENALTGARWTLRAICLLAPSGSAVGGGAVKLPPFADVSVLLDTAVRWSCCLKRAKGVATGEECRVSVRLYSRHREVPLDVGLNPRELTVCHC